MTSPITKGVTLIDCEYTHRPRFAGAYLIVNEGKAAFVDNNTTHSVPKLLSALRSEGLTSDAVEFIIITHVHLDHAGGTAELLKHCPNATVLAHPRAAPHVIDPSKLVSSARAVYGEKKFSELYGEISSIPASRVRSVEDDVVIPFGKGDLRFLHTRGHANHHFCILYRVDSSDANSKSAIFTGDAFGLAYPDLQSKGLFLFPSTSPTDFIADEAKKSVKRIVSSGAQEALLTHFGSVREFPSAEMQMNALIDASTKIVNDAVRKKLSGDALEKFCRDAIYAETREKFAHQGLDFTPDAEALLKLDLELNAQGLAHVARKALTK